MKNPIKYLISYMGFCIILWIMQSSVEFYISYGFSLIIVSYFYFVFGGFVGTRAFMRVKYHNDLLAEKHRLGTKIVVILLCINVVMVVFLMLMFFNAINNFSSLYDYRVSLFEVDTLKNYYGNYAAYLFLYSTIVPLLGISYGLYLRVTSGKSLILLTAITLLVLKESILLSRFYIFPVVLCVLVLLYSYDRKMTIKRVAIFGGAFLSIMFGMFVFRGESDFYINILNTRNYLIVGYSLFSRVIESNSFYSSFYDLSSPFLFMGTIGSKLFDFPSFFSKVQDFVWLGDAGNFNAFYTAFLIPYMYFGSFGLALLSFIFGFIISYIHKELKTTPFNFNSFNMLFSLTILFFAHQFLPVQLSFFWDYFIISLICYIYNQLIFRKWRFS